MRLNLGGGSTHLEGFINVDLCNEADLKHDLRNPLPFEDGSVEEIFAMHVIESFYQWEFPAVIKDWARVLKGKITIEFTSLTDTINLYLNGGNAEERKSGHWGLYGKQDIPIDPIVLHHYVYEVDELKELMERAGFTDIVFTQDGVMHKRGRDWRVSAKR